MDTDNSKIPRQSAEQYQKLRELWERRGDRERYSTSWLGLFFGGWRGVSLPLPAIQDLNAASPFERDLEGDERFKIPYWLDPRRGFYMDEERLYFSHVGGKSGWILDFIFRGAIFVGMFGLIAALGSTDSSVSRYIPLFLMIAIVMMVLAMVAWALMERAKRGGGVIVDRERGKLYVSNKGDHPHLELDPYEQIVVIASKSKGSGDSRQPIWVAPLILYLPFVVYGDRTVAQKLSLTLCEPQKTDQAFEVWQFILRFLDKSRPLSKTDREVIAYYREHRRENRYEVEEVRYPKAQEAES